MLYNHPNVAAVSCMSAASSDLFFAVQQGLQVDAGLIFSVASCGVHRIFLGEGGGKWGPKGDFKYEKRETWKKDPNLCQRRGKICLLRGGKYNYYK